MWPNMKYSNIQKTDAYWFKTLSVPFCHSLPDHIDCSSLRGPCPAKQQKDVTVWRLLYWNILAKTVVRTHDGPLSWLRSPTPWPRRQRLPKTNWIPRRQTQDSNLERCYSGNCLLWKCVNNNNNWVQLSNSNK